MHGTFQRRSPSGERRSVTPSSSSTVRGSPAQTSCTASAATGIAGYLGNPVVAIADLLSSRCLGDDTDESRAAPTAEGRFTTRADTSRRLENVDTRPRERAAPPGAQRG